MRRAPKGLGLFRKQWPSLVSGGGLPPVDKSHLINLINGWDESVEDHPPENYTPESYQAVLDAYNVALDVRDNPAATQEEVDTAYLNLLNAIAGLEEVPSGDECIYPLDITSEAAHLFGAELFDVQDDCFNHLKSEGNNDSVLIAAGSGVLESLVAGNNAPDNYVIRSGEALEVEVSWSTPDDVYYSILNLSILDEVESAQIVDISIYRNPISGEDASVFVREEITLTSNEVVSSNNTARIGLYYIEDELLVIVDGQVMLSCASSGGICIFASKDENSYSSSPPNTSSPVEFKLLTKAQDLTFIYPEGTRGLDGELVDGS